MKSKSVVLMIVSLGFGLIAAIGISQVMGKGGKGEATIERGQVLVAAVDLNHGDDLNEETVKIEHWPVEVIPETAARSFDDIKHKKIATRLSKTLPIMLNDTKNASEIDRVVIPRGFKLVAIKVSAEDSINGLLQPGDRVDLIGVVSVKAADPTTGKITNQTVSETFMKNVEVYAVNGNINSGGPRESGGGNTIVGVLVTEKQSELIVLGQKEAKLRLVMRGEADDFGDSDNEIVDYNDFYQSVYGGKDSTEVAATDEGDDVDDQDQNLDVDSDENHTCRVWAGDNFEEIKFVGKKRLTPTENGSSSKSDDFDDYDDREQSDEIESGLEEDQYPGE